MCSSREPRIPPIDKVEKVARAIYAARGAHEPPRAWRKWEDIGDEARAVWCQCALAAMGEREPVAWEHFRDESYFDLWCVRPTGERAFGVGFHVSTEAEAIALVETLAGKASPRPEAVEEAVKAERERCARIAEVDRRGELAKQCGYEPAFHAVGKAIAAAIRATEESKG